MAKKLTKVRLLRNNFDLTTAKKQGKSRLDGPTYLKGDEVEVDDEQIKRWNAVERKFPNKKMYEIIKQEDNG